jgi:hypothetical protein
MSYKNCIPFSYGKANIEEYFSKVHEGLETFGTLSFQFQT